MKTAAELWTRPVLISNKASVRELPASALEEETLTITEKSEKIFPPGFTFLAGGGQLVFNSEFMTVRRAATLAENNNNNNANHTKMTQTKLLVRDSQRGWGVGGAAI